MKTYMDKVFSAKRQYEIRNKWLKHRLNTILPRIMSESDIDMWIVIDREGNTDPVVKSFLPAEMVNSQRMTCFIFVKNGFNIERLSLFWDESGFLSEYYVPCWRKNSETQWQCLKRLIDKYVPAKIGLNYSDTTAFGDGISKSMYDRVVSVIEEGYHSVIASAEELCVKWYEERTYDEIIAYEGIDNIINGIVDDIFTSRSIHTGITTTEDLQWIIVDKIRSHGFNINFMCDVDLQRKGCSNRKLMNTTVLPGDLLRCDVGFEYLGLNVDIQRQVYIPDICEFCLPPGMKEGYEKVKEFQEIIADQYEEGKAGNQIFLDSIMMAEERGIKAELYIHPIGLHVHSAGPIMGLWDVQGTVPGAGDYVVRNRTCYAVEFFVDFYIQDWEQNISLYAEQLMVFADGKAVYYNGLHENIMLLKQKYI